MTGFLKSPPWALQGCSSLDMDLFIHFRLREELGLPVAAPGLGQRPGCLRAGGSRCSSRCRPSLRI